MPPREREGPTKELSPISRYAKFLIAVLGAVGTWGYTASEHGISTQEWFGLLGVVATALGVYSIPNTPPAGQPSDPNISETDPPRD